MSNPKQHQGITCRFGEAGIITESHFDTTMNALAMLYGSRRYILAPPSQCQHIPLLPRDHPSGRQSAIKFGDPDFDRHPEFENFSALELVMQAGDVLLLPTNWFHYIVQLETNFQCNAMQSKSESSDEIMHSCGF